ncbi:MAG: PEP-CTERM sorting domain-containing protein [Candidatus Poribacteria bacterium]|nr:PEP-CTERM sorting domain-containing protein [Candidatus Poribacteria bacterium]
MRIQVTFSGAAPTIDDIVAFDPLGAITVGPLNHVLDIPANPFATGYFYEDWLIFPNPDWEFVEIFVPTNTLLHQVVIDSYSTPEPSTLILFGISALGVVVYGWRRRKRAA